jgi:AmmeMemoRadiSam system protein A
MSQTSVASPDLRVLLPLTDADRSELLALARQAISDRLAGATDPVPSLENASSRLQEPGATFVTLRRGPHLLGTVGSLDSDRPLGQGAAEHALAAAFDDPRVPPVAPSDVDEMTIEISILGPRVPVRASSYDELVGMLEPGLDGLVVEHEGRRFTFLPAVWPEVRDGADFVALLWRKAGLAVGEWPDGGIRTWLYRAETVSDRSRS